MSQPDSGRQRVEEQFSLPLFLFTVAASLAGIVALLKVAAPDAVWQAQVSTTVWHFVAVYLAVSLLTCFAEYFFHRYVLHKPVVPLLSRFYRQHTLHHNLTRIGRRRTPGGREVPFVENLYPVTEPEQGEASFFPWYTLAVFSAAVTPLFALAQWLLPQFPWFLGGYAAVAGALALYEIFHAIEHWSFEKWAPLIEHRRFGWFWRKIYSFHLRHHAVIDCNEAISGFFTLPLADWVFGTFILPKSLYVDGSEWRPEEFKSPRPYAFIRWCDAKAEERVRRHRLQAQHQTAPAVGADASAPAYTRGEQVADKLTDGMGLVASIAGLVLLTTLAAVRGNAWHVASSLIFGLTLVFGYAAFANFRGTGTTRTRRPFTRRNHVAILLLIAGTATPFLLVSVRGVWGWSLFGAVWGLCLIGAMLRLFFTGRLQSLSTVVYLLVGLLPFVAIKPLMAAMPNGALWLLLVGVLCYLCGTVFHVWRQLRYHQVMRQAFALGGTACHLLAVLLFVLPGTA